MLLIHIAFNGEIIIPAPGWVSYEPQAEIWKNKVHWLETSRLNNWFPTGKELEKKIKLVGKKKNLILILNSPNNPSGATCGNLEELAKVAKKNKIMVLSDEIYTDLTFSNEYSSISQFYPELTFITGGLSKWCGRLEIRIFSCSKKINWIFKKLEISCEWVLFNCEHTNSIRFRWSLCLWTRKLQT